MLTGSGFPLEEVVVNRRKQVVFRLGICVATASCFAPLLGGAQTLLWTCAYAFLQAVEWLCFNTRRPLFPALDRPGRAVALTLLGLNSAVFGGFSLLETVELGRWGQVCAAYLLAGSILNTVLTTIGCRSAFAASLVPFLAYTILLPLRALVQPDSPSGFIIVGMMLAGLLLGLSAVRLWKEWSQAKAAERDAVARDIAERRANERRLIDLSHLDALTGLGNRTLLQARLLEFVGASGQGALLMVDLDGFKYVNDSLGHSAGDEVLRAIAGRISSSARGGDLAIRLGGDEFALLLPDVEDPAMAEQVAGRVIAAASLPVQTAGQSMNVGASVGIAIYPLHGANEQDLLANADLALYKAKADGRHCSRFYHPGLRVEAHRRLSRDRELLQAVERNEFELFFQPQIRLADRTLAGAEVSLRWRHPELGLLEPESFLPALDNGRRAVEVGTWMIKAACVQAALWRQRMPHLRISLNLLGAQFRSGDVVGTVETALATASLPPHALAVEVTETVLLQNGSQVVGPLHELRARGVGVTVDNFGTGHAALGLLKRLPLTRLKIDPAFTQAMCGHPSDRAMVRAIIGLARACDLQVIADGIESQSQADLLGQDGCDEAQGALFCPALDAEGFGAWTARHPRLPAKLPA